MTRRGANVQVAVSHVFSGVRRPNYTRPRDAQDRANERAKDFRRKYPVK
jgi:hypothetical protein